MMEAAEASRQFEKLPIIEYVDNFAKYIVFWYLDKI